MNSTKSAGLSKKTRTSSSANGVRASGTSEELRLTGIAFEGKTLVAQLTNGNRISIAMRRYPKLLRATPAQRSKWRLIGKGLGIHWPDIDEDLSVENLLFASARATM